MTKLYYFRFLWCLCLLTASTLTPIHAQTSSTVWNRTIENYLDQVKMATTSDGSVGVIVTGTRPGRPIELTKLDPSGNVAWQRPILGTRINLQNSSVPFVNLEVTQLYLIESTRDGGFVVVLQQRVFGSSSLLYMITKFDSSGNQLWIESIDENPPGATSSLLPISLSQTSDGGFIVGMGVSQTRFGPFVQLYKRNSLGREEWKQSYSSTTSLLNSRFAFLIINALTERNGGYAFTGISSEVFADGQTVNTPVLVFLDYSGQEINRRVYPAEFGLGSIDINFDPTDNSFIATSNNNQGRGILKLSSAGDVLFRTIIPRRAGDSQAYVAFAPNPQDGYIVADTDPVNEADFRLTRISRDGSQQTSQTFGGRQADYLQALDIQPNGNIVLAGVTRSTDGDLAARQSISPISSAPVAWVLSLNTSGTTPPVTPPVTPPSGFALATPNFNCNTGILSAIVTGNSGSPVEYRIIGVRDWDAVNVFFIPPWQRQGTNFTIEARQDGRIITRSFIADCSSSTFVPSPPSGDLAIQNTAYACSTGELTIFTRGGNGTPVEYRVPGLVDWQISPIFIVPIYQRRLTTFTVYARQSGREAQFTAVFACPNARIAVTESNSTFNAVVLPNPVVGNELVVEVTGAAGQIVEFALTDVSGRVMTTQRASVTTDRHRQTLAVGQLIEGMYLLRISTATQSKTVKIMKQ